MLLSKPPAVGWLALVVQLSSFLITVCSQLQPPHPLCGADGSACVAMVHVLTPSSRERLQEGQSVGD
jgi:hypothetical protein